MTRRGRDGDSRRPAVARSGFTVTGLTKAFRASWALALCLVALNSVHADSAASPAKPQQPRILFVDADHPSTWPKGLEPIPAGELRRLLGTDKDPDAEPATVQIEQAVYHATFRDGVLTEGRAAFTLGNGRRPALVPLEHSHLEPARLIDFSHLRWSGEPHVRGAAAPNSEVLCGIDRTGCRVVIADRGRSQLECDWSLMGRASLGATDFALCLPPAVVSQIVLRIPAGQSLECDQGVIVRGPKDPDGRNTLWQLELGSRCNCRLRIIASDAPGNQRVLYDQDTTFVAATDRLRLQSKLQLEVFGTPLRTLRLVVPAGLRVETISYGDDFPLPVPANSSDKLRELALDLPEPLFGKGRTITVEASAVTQPNRLENLPRVDVPGAVRREGQVQLTIRAPLKLVRFGGDAGLAQSEAPTYSIDGEETFFLHQNAGDPPLAIEIAEPAPALAARTLARLDLRRDRCTFGADIVCSASRGSTFSITFELPEAWDVTRVLAVGDVSRMVDETTRTIAEHRKRIKIDFFRAVTDREPKRFRVEATRPLPRSGEAIGVPVIEFPMFASQEVATLIVHGSSIELGLSPADAFAAFDPTAILSVLADSPLRPDQAASAEMHMLVHRWTAQTAKAHLTLRRGEEVLAAHVRTSVEISASQQISERVDAAIVPASPLDRVLVYLSAESAPFSWHLLTDRDRPVEGTRLTGARQAEWNLPEGGELWEIHFPEPCRNEFHLLGTRRTSSLGGAKIGLTFIPSARTFVGDVKLHLYDARQFDVETRDTRARNLTASGDRSLHYDRPGDVLVVRPRSTGISKGVARFASLQLTSYLNAGDADDFHRADFSIAPELAPQPFLFCLDADSRLCSVAVNGQFVRVQRRGGDIAVPALPADAWNHVQVEYKTRAVGRIFQEHRPVIVPRAQAEFLGFHWRVFLSPGLQPGELASGLRFDQPLPALSWAERLFGPLGRSAAQMRLSSFKPDAWIVDLAGVGPESETWTPGDRERPPAGWSSWDVFAEEIPANISLAIWHAGQFRTLAWIVCLGCLIAGLAVARFVPRTAHRLGPLVAAAAVALALAAPSPYALLAGGCVSGVLLAVVLSQPWKTVPAPLTPKEKRGARPGSTVSFELRAVSMLLALTSLGAIATFAQETRPTPAPPLPRVVQSAPAPSDARRPQSGTDGDLLVVIPVHPDRLPSPPAAALPDDKEIVYVSPAALDALRRHAAETARNEGTVLLSSDYAISLDERQPATIEAAYRVAVMPGPTRSLLLRLGNVTLAGANACRVNGQPFPIRKDDDGFVLSLDPDAPPTKSAPTVPADSAAAAARRPIPAERPSSATKPPISMVGPRDSHSEGSTTGSNAGSGQPRVYEIHLSCFPSGEAKTGQFEIQIPETAHTTVRVAKSGPGEAVTIEADGGKSRRLRRDEPSIDLGQTGRIRIKAGLAPSGTIQIAVAAQAVQFWRVSPGLVEMDCRVQYDRESGRPEKFTWLVPAAAAVRTPGGTYRAALRTLVPDQGGHISSGKGTASSRVGGANGAAAEQLVPLDFDCSAAPDGPLTLAATLLLPIDPSQNTPGAPFFGVPLPRFDAGGTDRTQITVTSNQLGISAAAGYRVIAATTEPTLSHTARVDPTFRQESFGTRKEPDVILDCQGISVLPLQLAATVPTHKVRLMTHEARLSADRIRWKTTAEIRTEHAPAFVHVLRVDRRLKIDSISVREDDVERLVRFSQSGDEVTLFLRDRAAATQDLVLTGHLPLESGHLTRLPTVSLVHAVISEVHLAISHDPDFDVAVPDSPGLVRLSGSVGASERPPGMPTSDVLEYSLSPGAAMPEVRLTRRPEVAQIAGAPGAAALKSGSVPAVEPQQQAKLAAEGRQATPEPPAINSAQQKPRVDVVAALELRHDRSVIGATYVLLERFEEPSLRLRWPASTILRGTLLDGWPVQPIVGDGWISFAVPSEPIPHRIALHWESRAGSSLSALARIHDELPVPVDGAVQEILLSVAAPTGFRLRSPAHFTPLDPRTFAGLCDAIQSPDRKSGGEEFPGLIRTTSTEAATETRLMGRLSVGPSDAGLSVWAIDTFWLRLPLAAAIFALIALAAVHPSAARAGSWLLNRAPLTLALIGLTWWFCLAPRAVAPLLLVIALALLIVDLRRGQPPSSRALPSTLQFPPGQDVR